MAVSESTLAEYVAQNATELQAITTSTFGIDPEAMMAVASKVQREWGYTGYRIAIVATNCGSCLFEVSHFDGSRFRLFADRWGNIELVPEQSA